MSASRPPTTGYALIAQAEEELSDDNSVIDELSQSYASLQPASAPRYASISQPRRQHSGMVSDGYNTPSTAQRPQSRRRMRSNSSGVDIKAINARLERWADEIAAKFKIGRNRMKKDDEETLEIHHSVFQAPDGVRSATAETLAHENVTGRMTKEEFDAVIESVNIAIEQHIHPKLITQGSSGSYFCRNSEGKTVGVFKPKDEEPYAAGNPKWNKWIHRNLFPCCFGRICLIPNLSYVSEAAAYTLDCQLRTNLVPYTDIVHLSSKSFHYDYWSRHNFYRKKNPFPPKQGSFQIFLQGYSDATVFLRKHPWPDQLNGNFRPSAAPRKSQTWSETCRPSGVTLDDDDEESPAEFAGGAHRRKFFWTAALQTSFREELEKLVILDYIMRNTDRGLDNWMIKVDWASQEVSIISDPPQMKGLGEEPQGPRPVSLTENIGLSEFSQTKPYRQQQPMKPHPTIHAGPTISIGAIDNSLSWPWKHPDAWRSYPFGWLFLPVSLIGQPFSQKTRDHFLPLLTSKQWWSETQLALRKVFSQDADFQERMFGRQIAVMKGQAWNVVETLKMVDHGPLELTRRARVCVWDDIVEVPVVMPMHAQSSELRNRREVEPSNNAHEEMDISVANDSAPQVDLLALESPPADLPNPNRFEFPNASPRPSEDSSKLMSPQSPREIITGGFPENLKSAQAASLSRPSHGLRTSTRLSYSGSNHSSPQPPRRNTRRFSFSTRSGYNFQMYGEDDLEGDLGYAAAEGMEGNRRRVIVERLETVKSKNPVFTWC